MVGLQYIIVWENKNDWVVKNTGKVTEPSKLLSCHEAIFRDFFTNRFDVHIREWSSSCELSFPVCRFGIIRRINLEKVSDVTWLEFLLRICC